MEWNTCWYCGKKLKWNQVTHDHVQPKTLGGDKFVTACHPCNSAKGDLSVEEFRLVGFSVHYRFYGEIKGWEPW